MSLPTRSAAYEDCYTLYSVALSTPGGVRQIFRTANEANLFQLRMHQARSILHTEARRIYPPDHKLHDTSEFDGLQCQVRGPDPDGNWWVYVRPHGIVLDYEPIEPGDPMYLPIRGGDTLLIEHQEESDLA